LNPNLFGVGIDFNNIVEDITERNTKGLSNRVAED